MPRILVAEDDADIAGLVRHYLEKAEFEVDVTGTGRDVAARLRATPTDLLVLDVMLPGLDGLSVCRALRADPATAAVPIIMLTAKAEESDRIAGLELGADDYITKPFSPRELVARIRAMLRRPRVLQSAATTAETDVTPPRRFGALSIDVAAREVRIDDEQILLTRTEFDILEALSGRPGNVLSRRQLLEIVRDGPWVGNEHLVDVHIGHLRRKLGDDAASPRYIATVRGVGYRMGTGQ